MSGSRPGRRSGTPTAEELPPRTASPAARSPPRTSARSSTPLGETLKQYVQSQPSDCAYTNSNYESDDVPFGYFADMKDNPAYCDAHRQPLTQLIGTDLRSASGSVSLTPTPASANLNPKSHHTQSPRTSLTGKREVPVTADNPISRLGAHDKFGRSMTFAQSLLGSINVSGIRSDVVYLRTSDPSLIARSPTIPARLIHIMSHGGTCDHGDPGFGGTNDTGERSVFLGLHDLASYLQIAGEGIEATALFADACDSGQQKFTTALRGSIESPLVYIGATRRVDWHECSTFDSILYGSMLRAKGKGTDAHDWMLDSARRSVDAYTTAVDGPCAFKVIELTPDRGARRAFQEARPAKGLE